LFLGKIVEDLRIDKTDSTRTIDVVVKLTNTKRVIKGIVILEDREESVGTSKKKLAKERLAEAIVGTGSLSKICPFILHYYESFIEKDFQYYVMDY
jgi:hypothetical protein